MKSTTLLAGVLLAAIAAPALSSCQSDEKRLASAITGEWASTPDTMTDSQAVTATLTDNWYFYPDTATQTDSKYPAGPMTVSTLISMNTQIVSEGSMIEPLSLSASAIATVKGTWNAVDDDELSVMLDPATITVSVDPDQIASNGSPLTSDDVHIDSIRPAIQRNLEASLRGMLEQRYASIRLLDDVKVKGNTLRYEIGDRKYVLTRTEENLGN